MKEYKNLDTGEIWTEEEIRFEYDHDQNLQETYSSFEKCLEHLLDLGKQKIGGIEELN